MYQRQRVGGIQPIRTTDREEPAKEWGVTALPVANLHGIPSDVQSVPFLHAGARWHKVGNRTARQDQGRAAIKEGYKE